MEAQEKRRPNALVHEKSPYLLQHAYNPVQWMPWGTESFAIAKREQKPVFLSIGYSTCHWCHVMERESFEDSEVAEILNRSFICIKVDREERPDIDHIYMAVCQAMTGHGGWPMSMFLTPDKHPFYAGTYFPKASRHGLMGFVDLLELIEQKWETDRERIIESGADIVKALQSSGGTMPQQDVTAELLDEAVDDFRRDFDRSFGGFGSAPKFPSPHQLLFLLRQTVHLGDDLSQASTLEMVEKTLDSLAAGGIYDHVGGGFSRYSTDREWLVPHFEKMLYDNALLSYVYAEAFQAFHKPLYETVVRETLEYLLRDMCSEDGMFYSAEDADSQGVEGKFYVWSKEEIMRILGAEKGERFCNFYGVTDVGNFEGKNILNRIGDTYEDFCSRYGIDATSWNNELAESNRKLLNARAERVRPSRDDKILTGWNALTICAFAKAGKVFDDARYTKIATRAMDWILSIMIREGDGRLMARYRDGERAITAYLDDYAYLTWAALELYEATWDAGYLMQAISLQRQTQSLFWDEDLGGYFFTGIDAEQLPVRAKEWYDGALPSGNSVEAMNLLKLSHITASQEWREVAYRHLCACSAAAKQYPAGHAFYLCALSYYAHPSQEIVLAGPEGKPVSEALKRLQQGWFPDSILIYRPDEKGSGEVAEGQDVLLQIAPFLAEQGAIQNEVTLYVCRNYACELPVTLEGQILEKIAELSQSFPCEFASPR